MVPPEKTSATACDFFPRPFHRENFQRENGRRFAPGFGQEKFCEVCTSCLCRAFPSENGIFPEKPAPKCPGVSRRIFVHKKSQRKITAKNRKKLTHRKATPLVVASVTGSHILWWSAMCEEERTT
jgi:hypothetical protein